MDKGKGKISDWTKYSSLGLQMLIFIGIFLGGGMYLDEYFLFQKPILTALGAFLGVILGMISVIKSALKK